MSVVTGTGPLFVTVNGRGGNGIQNPWSVLVIEELRKREGCSAAVLNSPPWEVRGKLVVSLYDVECGVNRWSPRPKDTSGTPDWARALSSGSCVAVGQRCAASPVIMERTACQILTIFLKEWGNGGRGFSWGKHVWGPAPSTNRSSRRRSSAAMLRYCPWGTRQSHLTR